MYKMYWAPAATKFSTFVATEQVPRLVSTRKLLRSGVPGGKGLHNSAVRLVVSVAVMNN